MSSQAIDQHRRLRLSAFYFALYAAYAGYAPYFSLLLHERGLAPKSIGIIIALSFMLQILATGALAWRWPRHLGAHTIPQVIAGMAVCVLPMLLAPAAPSWLIVVCVLGLFILMNALGIQFECIVLSSLRGTQSSYGGLRAWGAAGFGIMAAAYGAAIQLGGVAVLPWMVMLWIIVMMVLSNPIKRQDIEPDHGHAAILPRTERCAVRRWRRPGWGQPGALGILAVLFLAQTAAMPYNTMFSMFLHERAALGGWIGMLMAMNVAAEYVVMMTMGPLARLSPKKIIITSLAMTAVRWLVIAAWPTWPVALVLGQILYGAAFALFYVTSALLIANLVNVEALGLGQWKRYAVRSMGWMLGALMAAASWSYGRGRAAFAISALLCLAAIVVATRLPEHAVAHAEPWPQQP